MDIFELEGIWVGVHEDAEIELVLSVVECAGRVDDRAANFTGFGCGDEK